MWAVPFVSRASVSPGHADELAVEVVNVRWLKPGAEEHPALGRSNADREARRAVADAILDQRGDHTVVHEQMPDEGPRHRAEQLHVAHMEDRREPRQPPVAVLA